jgi:hypothetical protein
MAQQDLWMLLALQHEIRGIDGLIAAASAIQGYANA